MSRYDVIRLNNFFHETWLCARFGDVYCQKTSKMRNIMVFDCRFCVRRMGLYKIKMYEQVVSCVLTFCSPVCFLLKYSLVMKAY